MQPAQQPTTPRDRGAKYDPENEQQVQRQDRSCQCRIHDIVPMRRSSAALSASPSAPVASPQSSFGPLPTQFVCQGSPCQIDLSQNSASHHPVVFFVSLSALLFPKMLMLVTKR